MWVGSVILRPSASWGCIWGNKSPRACRVRWGMALTSVPGEVEAEDGGAVVAQVLQGLQVLLQFPVGQLCLQEWRQAAED